MIRLVILYIICYTCAYCQVAINVGEIQQTLSNIAARPDSAPVFKVMSVGVNADPIMIGQVATVDSNVIGFEVTQDYSEETINPFVPDTLKATIQQPILNAVLSGSGVGSINIDFPGVGLSTAPQIVIDHPTTGDDQATAVVSISATGEVDSINITNTGSGYTIAPQVRVICGPHLLRITEPYSEHEGRCFLIAENNQTHLTLYDNKLKIGEVFSDLIKVDHTIEVVPAPTLGSVFGRTQSELLLNYSNGDNDNSGADFVYLYFMGSYHSFCFQPAGNGRDAGWYSTSTSGWGRLNDLVIYPNESFIVSKRTNGSIDLGFSGSINPVNQKLQLPQTNDVVITNNPYGTDVLLTELIPDNIIGVDSTSFRPGTGDTDEFADIVFVLNHPVWASYYRMSGVNDNVTSIARVTARAGSGSNNSIADIDMSMSSGNVTNMTSCDINGATVDHNMSLYTRVTLTGVAPQQGHDITLSGMFGRKLDDESVLEIDINGTTVPVGHGIFITSTLNNRCTIFKRVSDTTIIIKRKRDINMRDLNDNIYTRSGVDSPKWTTGHGGSGYNSDAKAYFLGGGNTTMAVATAVVSGGKVTSFNFSGSGDTRGAGYTSSPQVVISSGGWRKVGASNPNNTIQDGSIINATDGLIIHRKNPIGVLTHFSSNNPVSY